MSGIELRFEHNAISDYIFKWFEVPNIPSSFFFLQCHFQLQRAADKVLDKTFVDLDIVGDSATDFKSSDFKK